MSSTNISAGRDWRTEGRNCVVTSEKVIFCLLVYVICCIFLLSFAEKKINFPSPTFFSNVPSRPPVSIDIRICIKKKDAECSVLNQLTYIEYHLVSFIFEPNVGESPQYHLSITPRHPPATRWTFERAKAKLMTRKIDWIFLARLSSAEWLDVRQIER